MTHVTKPFQVSLHALDPCMAMIDYKVLDCTTTTSCPAAKLEKSMVLKVGYNF